MSPSSSPIHESTTEWLLVRARADDPAAREALMARFLPVLRRWARGRLPHYARDLSSTDDLVQVTLMRALRNLEGFAHRGAGSFLAYLRLILVNAVREEIRRSRAHASGESMDAALLIEDEAPSPIEQLAGAEALRDYEAALGRLPRRQQELVVMRVEFGMSFPEIAAETGESSDTVRKAVARALERMAERMGDGRKRS